MAKNGSGRVLSFTRAATTVVGTVASCHPLGTKAAVEMISPLASTLAEDCRVQCSCRTSLLGRPAWALGFRGVSAARRECAPRNTTISNRAATRVGKAGRLSFSEFMLSPWAIAGPRLQIISVDLGPGIRWITRLLIRFNG